jgi:hypothetical protein
MVSILHNLFLTGKVHPYGTRLIRRCDEPGVECRMSLNSESSNGASWRVSVGGKVYGPYNHAQMESFVTEGRIAAHSIVASGDTGPWLAATDDPLLATLFFRNVSREIDAQPKPKAQPVTEHLYVTDAKPHGFNYVVVADIKTRSGYGFERELSKLGDNYRLSMTVFLLRTDFPISQVRNALVQHLGKTDSLLVVEANQSKSAWFNLGPQAEAHIRRVWQRH